MYLCRLFSIKFKTFIDIYNLTQHVQYYEHYFLSCILILQGKGSIVTYWLLGELQQQTNQVGIQTSTNESGSVSHLSSFRNRMDQASRSSSRRGSGIFIRPNTADVNRLEKEVQPLLQTLTLQRQLSDPVEPLSNGGATNDSDNATFTVVSSITSPNHSLVGQISQPKVRIKDAGNSIGNHKANRTGINNWIHKIPTASSFDNGTKKNNNEHLKDYSSVPLLSKADIQNDSNV